jgi:hypothetical protein
MAYRVILMLKIMKYNEEEKLEKFRKFAKL